MEQLPWSPQGLSLKDKKEQLDTALKGSECTKSFVTEREEILPTALTSQLRKEKGGKKKKEVLTENNGSGKKSLN